MPKLTGTRDEVKAIRAEDKTLTLQQIGNQVGISRERVRQLLQEEGLPTQHEGWAEPMYCEHCGAQVPLSKQNTRYCSWSCHLAANRAHFKCQECGKTFTRRKSDTARNPRYCSKECQGRWLGKHHRPARREGPSRFVGNGLDGITIE